MNLQHEQSKSNSRLPGFWYPQGSSQRYNATLLLDIASGEFELVATPESSQAVESRGVNVSTINADHATAVTCRGAWDSIGVSSRMGNTPRKLHLSDGSLFESNDNDLIDQILKASGHQSRHGTRASSLERSWSFVLVSLVCVALSAVLFFYYGIPAGSRYIAHKLPVSAQEKASQGTLAALDRVLFSESELTTSEQSLQQQSFQNLLDGLPENEHTFSLHLRKMRDLPNAFALPSGDVVVTDALVTLAENQQEIESVMLHEIGHVIHRHGMQQVLQGSAITLLFTLALGDLSGVAQVMAGVPIFLAQSNYSRKAELQADEYAFENMQALGVDTIHFANIITRMGEFRPGQKLSGDITKDGKTTDEERELPPYLSSHPATSERANRARQLSESAR